MTVPLLLLPERRERQSPSFLGLGVTQSLTASTAYSSTYKSVPPSRRLHLFDLPSHTSSFVLVVVAAVLENRPFIDTRSVL